MIKYSDSIFIVGAMRSGTTYLGRLINAHSKIRITQEFALSYQRQVVTSMITKLASSQKFGDIPHEQCVGWANDVALKYIEMLIRMELQRTRKKRYGDRTPLNSTNMNVLNMMFPKSFFIHVVRDGRAVAASLLERQRIDPRFMNKEWAPKTGFEAAQSWVKTIRTIKSFSEKLPNKRYLEIRYEDFSSNLIKVVRDIFEFLGEEIDEGVMEIRNQFFKNPRSWEKTFASSELNSFLLNVEAKELMKELGYI